MKWLADNTWAIVAVILGLGLIATAVIGLARG